MKIAPRSPRIPEQSFFLFGPRGTGKSTWIRHVLPEALYVDLLAGRAVHRTLHPFMAAELETFRLAEALEAGLLPLVVASTSPGDVLDAYASLYLEQEVKLEGCARDVGSFARFLEAISFSYGSVLNVANVARECEVSRPTVAAFVEVLEDLLLASRVPVFTRRARRETSAHPKLYLFDAGVFRSLRPRGPLDRPEEIEGAALEGLVAQHLRAWVAYRGTREELFLWRSSSSRSCATSYPRAGSCSPGRSSDARDDHGSPPGFGLGVEITCRIHEPRDPRKPPPHLSPRSAVGFAATTCSFVFSSASSFATRLRTAVAAWPRVACYSRLRPGQDDP
jgi:predicted AAA+ superfamily ATPase